MLAAVSAQVSVLTLPAVMPRLSVSMLPAATPLASALTLPVAPEAQSLSVVLTGPQQVRPASVWILLADAARVSVSPVTSFVKVMTQSESAARAAAAVKSVSPGMPAATAVDQSVCTA